MNSKSTRNVENFMTSSSFSQFSDKSIVAVTKNVRNLLSCFSRVKENVSRMSTHLKSELTFCGQVISL